MKLQLTIDSNDEHAQLDPHGLVIGALNDVINAINTEGDNHAVHVLYDDNGNRIGQWEIEL